MKREILFRGKVTKIHARQRFPNRMAVGDWVYGSYVDYPVVQIFDLEDEYIVDPATVGQFTGLYDKNGKKIFEGDILMSSRWSCPCHVSFMDGGFTLEEGETAENLGANFYDCEGDEIEDIQVIGNIHDTPDLGKERS